ncbi:desulfoferrodoxin family protein [Candidatus Margulisiibacteriota bacterium]
MKIYICSVCGYISFNEAPDNCPVCHAPKDKFSQNDNIFKESSEKSPEAEVKHIPSVQVVKTCGLIKEENCTDIIVRIGETLHPMEEKHYITFIDCYVNEIFAARMELTPQANPAAVFHLKAESGKVTIVEKCNIHGYWMKDSNI